MPTILYIPPTQLMFIMPALQNSTPRSPQMALFKVLDEHPRTRLALPNMMFPRDAARDLIPSHTSLPYSRLGRRTQSTNILQSLYINFCYFQNMHCVYIYYTCEWLTFVIIWATHWVFLDHVVMQSLHHLCSPTPPSAVTVYELDNITSAPRWSLAVTW